ncbi:MAG: hypothetical protein D6760_04060 [Deltaproteobacteria bacterium]|nr:MAG: hypothetical protein D6760_04060 [Deltaproteobacteria bacterium]
MRSVADDLRKEDREAVAALSPAERIRLALRLGEESLAIYMACHAVDRETALAHFRRRMQAGRRSSRCLRDADE